MAVDASRSGAADALAARLKSDFTERGFTPVEPGMLLPADLVLDRLGEDIRRRLLLVTAPDGEELCVRPDFTLPVARHYLELAPNVRGSGRFAYAGLVFRFPAGGEQSRRGAEFRQAGIEQFGDTDPIVTDAEIVATTLAVLTAAGCDGIRMILGDVAIFEALLDGLAIGEAARRRIRRGRARGETADAILAGLDVERGIDTEESTETAFAAALADMSPANARAVVEEVMAIAGAVPVGGRTPAEIAARFVEQAQGGRGGAPDAGSLDALRSYLNIEGPARGVLDELSQLCPDSAAYVAAITTLAQRLDRIEDAGHSLTEARFDAKLAGRTGYYTGMVFEVLAADAAAPGPLASGGRYDGFMADIGGGDVSAVGASIYVDRVVEATGAVS